MIPGQVIIYDEHTVHQYFAMCDLGLVPQSDDSGTELRKPSEAMVGMLRGTAKLKQLYSDDWFGDGLLLYKRR